MHRRIAARWFLAVGVVIALLAIPAVAWAATVEGTVTAAATGAPLEGMRVEGYYSIGTGYWWIGSTTTDAEGHYSLSFSPGQDVTFSVRALDLTGAYDQSLGAEQPIATDETKQVDLAMSKDTRPPVTALYLSSGSSYYGPSSLSIAAVIPPGFESYGLMSDGSGSLMLEADDSWYRSFKYWGYSDGSGFGTVSYSLDGQPWVTEGPSASNDVSWYDQRAIWMRVDVPMPSEGLHSIRYFAVDANGNTGKVRNALLVVDKTPPVTTYNKRTATLQKLKLTASDNLSGVTSTFMRYGTSGPFWSGTNISVPKSGSKTVQFYSTDKVGNAETPKTLLVSSKAALSTPMSSKGSVNHKYSFTVSGSVWGRTKAMGTLRIYKLKGGSYIYVGKRYYTEGADGKYHVTMNLGSGTYKFKAVYGGYTPTWANPPAASKMSSKVRVY